MFWFYVKAQGHVTSPYSMSKEMQCYLCGQHEKLKYSLWCNIAHKLYFAISMHYKVHSSESPAYGYCRVASWSNPMEVLSTLKQKLVFY